MCLETDLAQEIPGQDNSTWIKRSLKCHVLSLSVKTDTYEQAHSEFDRNPYSELVRDVRKEQKYYRTR